MKGTDSSMEAGMKPLGIGLGLAAMAMTGAGIVAICNDMGPPASRIGPGWFQSASMSVGTALLLVGVVLAIATAQAGAGWFERAEPRGLPLGRVTLRVGAISLGVGLLLPALMFLVPMPPILLAICLKLPPVLLAIGVVLLRSSAIALGRGASHPPRILTLGEAALRAGFVVILLAWSISTTLPRGLGLLGTLIWMDGFPAGVALMVLGALIQAMEPGMRPMRTVLGLAAILLLCTGVATYAAFPPASRIAPGWLQPVSASSGTVLLLVGMVASIASAQAGSGGFLRVEPRGLRLGQVTLLVGAISLGVGLLLPALMVLHLVPSPLFLILRKLTPLLIPAGAVLLWSSAVALRRGASRPPRILTLGAATVGMGFVLLIMGWSMLVLGMPRGPGFLRFVTRADGFPAGLALLILGTLIRATERSMYQDQRSFDLPEPCPEPA